MNIAELKEDLENKRRAVTWAENKLYDAQLAEYGFVPGETIVTDWAGAKYQLERVDFSKPIPVIYGRKINVTGEPSKFVTKVVAK